MTDIEQAQKLVLFDKMAHIEDDTEYKNYVHERSLGVKYAQLYLNTQAEIERLQAENVRIQSVADAKEEERMALTQEIFTKDLRIDELNSVIDELRLQFVRIVDDCTDKKQDQMCDVAWGALERARRGLEAINEFGQSRGNVNVLRAEQATPEQIEELKMALEMSEEPQIPIVVFDDESERLRRILTLIDFEVDCVHMSDGYGTAIKKGLKRAREIVEQALEGVNGE